MRSTFGLARVAVAAAGLALAGCATAPRPVAESPPAYRGAPVVAVLPVHAGKGPPLHAASHARPLRGQVVRIERIARQAAPTGAGAVVGGVAGAVIGREIAGGGGDGKAIGTVVGAVTGAVIGHEIERSQLRQQPAVRVTVALDRGGSRSVELADAAGLRVGDRVRLQGDRIVRL